MARGEALFRETAGRLREIERHEADPEVVQKLDRIIRLLDGTEPILFPQDPELWMVGINHRVYEICETKAGITLQAASKKLDAARGGWASGIDGRATLRMAWGNQRRRRRGAAWLGGNRRLRRTHL
jgi:hypothetical protein